MYQVIARKYRPQAFAGLIGQEHVKTTLENAIAQGRIAHGYIFSGQRGTGKTTVARILARCLNCEQGPTATPCGKCASCLEIAAGSGMDVIEIDAASNRGINEMRELRENVRFRPARDRYKVFIVDEAHQITNEAFNALLKTLEEPPEWVVFILCTTEAHKIPQTIVSRCQQFSFRSVEFGEVVARMEWIIAQEGIQADADVLIVLAQAGEGSVRDSLSALDQAIACCGTTLNAAEVRALLGMFSLDSLVQVAQALLAGDSRKMLDIAAELESNGRSLQHFSRELARYFRNLLVVKIASVPTRLIAASPSEQAKLAETAGRFSEEDLTRYLQLALDLFGDLQSSLQPRLHLEIGLLRMIHAARLQPIEEALAALGGPENSGAKKTAPPAPATAAPRSTAAPSGDTRARLHAALLEARHMHLADALENSALIESPNELVFTAPKLYVMYLKEAAFESAVRAVLGKPIKVVVKTGEAPAAPIAAQSSALAQPSPRPADEASTRALANPEVQRFQEAFPESHVRKVRDLREN
ncbi:MAG: DNA polymerase III subunit gamma/tau [Bryobacteraceae bacterium]